MLCVKFCKQLVAQSNSLTAKVNYKLRFVPLGSLEGCQLALRYFVLDSDLSSQELSLSLQPLEKDNVAMGPPFQSPQI